MSGAVDVLAVMDTVARGCALHADKCVGEVGERWDKVATVDYDEARAAVAELIEADKEYDAALSRQPTQFLGRGYAKGMDRIEQAKSRRAAALARVQGGAE